MAIPARLHNMQTPALTVRGQNLGSGLNVRGLRCSNSVQAYHAAAQQERRGGHDGKMHTLHKSIMTGIAYEKAEHRYP